ncbi:MAG: TonB-dependent receptor plug domain-containing protein, partial [Chitinophagaceae bacterium]
MKKDFFVVAAIIISSQLRAQLEPLQQEDTTTKSLNEVVVTATRFPKKMSETGKVVTVISKAELERAGGKDIAQLLNEQAGLIVNGATSNPGKDKSVFLRGTKTSYTVILINGVPVNDPTGIGGAFDLRMLPIEQIERIEILKGAQSTLYGSDAIAGVINIITKKGDGKPANFYGGFSTGSYNTIKAHAGLNGEMEGTSYNITFTHNETKGVPEAKDTNAIKTFPKNGFVGNAVSMDFDGKIFKGLHLKPFFRYSYFSGTYSDGAFAPAQNRFKSNLLSGGSQAQYSFAKGSVTGLFSYDEVSRNYSSSFGNSLFEGNKKTAEVFSHYNFGEHFQALAGFRYDRFMMKDPSPAITDTATHLSSPYFALFLKNIGGFNLELGGRYNDHSQYGDNFIYTINPSYLINGKVKIFANYGTAFKAPAISELFGQYGSNINLKPEKSKTLEGGVQASLFKNKLDVRVVYFKRKIKDVIVYDAAFTYTNYDNQNDHGFEIEPTLYINKDITIKLSYAFVDGEVTAKIGGKDTTYFNLIRRPKHSVGANISYQLTPSLFVNTNIRSIGQRDDLFFNSITFKNDPVLLEAYTLLDAYAEYSLAKKKLKLFAQVNNILDADYYEVYGFTVPGTNFIAGFRYKL